VTPKQWQQVKELFEAALERGPSERAAFLAQACQGDESIKREVESLLAAHERDSGFMNTPVGHLAIGNKPMLATGQHFGPYEEISPLGEGGMGQVYLAVDTRLGRKVALKLLPSSYTGDADRVRRFGQEARAASALNHPNIVTIHEIGQVDSIHFIATEFVEGETLREHMLIMRMTVGEVLDVAAQIASALQAAHEAGIVHRDVKPENIMLRPDGFVKVLDFGLAKLAPDQVVLSLKAPTGSTVKTNPGVVMGTAAYMSPEQARGAEVDARTDVWSLGVVLYEMVAGRPPFEGETQSHVIVSILESELPISVDAGVPAEMEQIISKALRKDRAERYQTAGDMALALKSLKEELTVESRLKQFRRSDADGKDTATSYGRVALETPHPSAWSTADVAIAQLKSGAEYMVKGIKRHKGGAVFASVTAFLLIASLLYFFYPAKGGVEAINSVAVVHFVNEGGNPETEYLSEGISNSVINNLSRLPNLKVISLRYMDKQIDPQKVGYELNVRAVLVGRITQQGDALAISTELVDVRDNRRLWGAQYNRKLSDVPSVQNEISQEIAERLRLKLDVLEKHKLTKDYTENSDAYDAYTRGRFMLEKRTGPAVEKSVEYLEQAVKLDPYYAAAYAALSYAYWSSASVGRHPPDEVLPKAKAAAARALEIDETVAEAHTALGHIRQTERDWAGAERAFRRAIELNPNSGFAHSNYAFHFIAMKRFGEGVTESKRAVELEPTSVLFNRNVALNLYFARRYDEAIEQSRKTLELDPNMATAYSWLGMSYEQKGLYDQAVEAYLKRRDVSGDDPEKVKSLREAYATSGWKGFWRRELDLAKERAKQMNVPPYAFAEIYVRLGDQEQSFAWLEKTFEDEPGWGITTLNADPRWDGLRSDPRYADLVRRMGLEP
jgi:serine/threonine protein kinase